ncbi:MAG: hypothetical protein IPJ61_01760 [Tessaracoccus sp.]|uniref:hypothetical protein n=1 Tax=Tessaracoccus sp. TaxID=1971211 RepID=UPI001EB2423F|nr:hypothetical protein [Tessaracoccus sp.]MBK7819820.1 hypothetical protein [Tessaracoccus sp.]
MNTTDGPQHTDPRHDPQHVVPTPADEALSVPRDGPDAAVEASTTSEAVRAAQVARTEKQHAAVVVRGRGVEWVRPTDLMARHSANVAGRGLDFQAELARRTRTPLRIGMQAARDRARRLPPITAFGRHTVTTSAPTRPGVGIG